MSEEEQATQQGEGAAEAKASGAADAKARRRGSAPLVPFTVMLRPADLATVKMIAKASKRTAGDLMREMLSYGLAHMLERAFGHADAEEDESPGHDDEEELPGPDDVIDAEPESEPSRPCEVEGAAIDPAARALSQRGAREIVDYAKAHPRAKLAELEAAGHMSHTTLYRRIGQLEAAGVMKNVGSGVRPLWKVAGVERDPEDELSERQAAVLALMRREPPAKTPEIASAIGTSTATVFTTYRELAALGLAEKDSNSWVAVRRRTDAITVGVEDAIAAAPDPDEAARVLSRKGAPEVVAYATAHPRATRGELQEAAGVSYETLRTRLRELAEAGVMANAGTTKEPLWQIRGVARDDPEELLTEKQRGVLECLRRDPIPGTRAMAAELGMSRSMAGYVLQQLADLGLVAKAPNNRWYAVRGEDEGAAGDGAADGGASGDEAAGAGAADDGAAVDGGASGLSGGDER